MVKFNSKAANVESASALAELRKYQQGVEPYAAYVRIEVTREVFTDHILELKVAAFFNSGRF